MQSDWGGGAHELRASHVIKRKKVHTMASYCAIQCHSQHSHA